MYDIGEKSVGLIGFVQFLDKSGFLLCHFIDITVSLADLLDSPDSTFSLKIIGFIDH